MAFPLLIEKFENLSGRFSIEAEITDAITSVRDYPF